MPHTSHSSSSAREEEMIAPNKKKKKKTNQHNAENERIKFIANANALSTAIKKTSTEQYVQ